MFCINFDDDWIRSVDLWIWKQLPYQLSHNHYAIVDSSLQAIVATNVTFTQYSMYLTALFDIAALVK